MPTLTPSTGGFGPHDMRIARSMVPSPPRLTMRSERLARSAGATPSTRPGTRLASSSTARTVTLRLLAQASSSNMAELQSRPGCSTTPTVLTMPTGQPPQVVMRARARAERTASDSVPMS